MDGSSPPTNEDNQKALESVLLYTHSNNDNTKNLANNILQLYCMSALNEEQTIFRNDITITIKLLSSVDAGDTVIINQLHRQFGSRVESML